ncbi:hypothetical protein AVEN_12473-1 [Araneus ventricosus]|uniref:Uncharacterized protein n=1 Tax=Araneus ventricosus TaxID=182803 RepID=A0A4Y2IRR8_ARAVE|nr:hypothetical protein AVEN_12473-1 [Araneus ventricosus]
MPEGAIASVHSSTAKIFPKPSAVLTARCSNSTDLSPEVQNSGDSRFGQGTRRWNKALVSNRFKVSQGPNGQGSIDKIGSRVHCPPATEVALCHQSFH